MQNTDIHLDAFARLRWNQKNLPLLGDFVGASEEDYFCWKWSLQRFRSQMHETTNAIPSDETILNSIIGHDAFCDFLFELKHVHRIGLAAQLLEIYQDDVERLVIMWSWAKSSGSLGQILVGDRYRNATHAIESFHEQALKDLRSHTDYPSYNDANFDYEYDFLDTLCYGEGRYTKGLYEFLSAKYADVIQGGILERLAGLKLACGSAGYDHSFLQTPDFKAPTGEKPSIVFSVSGSGKTQYLFDFLCHEWGFYIVSGRVPREAGCTRTLLEANQGLASSDTRHMCEMLDRINLTGECHYEKAWNCLGQNRYRTFAEIQKLVQNGSHEVFSMRDWLLYQTVCTEEFDPFSRSFSIRLLLDDYDDIRQFGHDCRGDIHMYWCFDEAQCEVFGPQGRSNPSKSLTALADMQIGELFPFNSWRLLVSGTSLQLKTMQNLLENSVNEARATENLEDLPGAYDMMYDLVRKAGYKAPVFDQFKTINNDSDFGELLESYIRRLVARIAYLVHIENTTEKYGLWQAFAIESHNVDKAQFYRRFKSTLPQPTEQSIDRLVVSFLGDIGYSADSSRDLVFQASQPFRGRIQWSCIFVEQLFIAYLDRDIATEALSRQPVDLKAVSYTAQKTIKTQLKRRIQSLQAAGEYSMLRDLFLTAIRADLMNRPCIFSDTETAEMITNGFALIQSPTGSINCGVIQQLAEPLVITAVIEYLRENESTTTKNRLENIITQLLFDHQQDFGTIGSIAESYLAWAFSGLLQPGDTPHLHLKRKEKLMSRFADAAHIPRRSANKSSISPKLGDIKGYVLVESCKIRDIKLGKTISFHDWMSRVMDDKYFPSVYFPPHDAGPDIVFFIKDPTESKKKKILCALQIKVGAEKDNMFGIIRTLDPNLWFSGITMTEYQALSSELSKRQSDFIILTGLVAAFPNSKVLSEREKLLEILQELRGPVQDYTILATKKDEPIYHSVQSRLIQSLKTKIRSIGISLQKQNPLAKGELEKLEKEKASYERVLSQIYKTDQRQKTLAAQSLLRDAVVELFDKIPTRKSSEPEWDHCGHDFYFTTIDASDLSQIVGEGLGILLKASKN